MPDDIFVIYVIYHLYDMYGALTHTIYYACIKHLLLYEFTKPVHDKLGLYKYEQHDPVL